MSEQKIIFFDIDGTLLDHNKNLPASAKAAVLELKQRGYEVAIATGRAPFMFEELREELDIDSYVSFNGQYVVLRGEVIHTHPLNPARLQALTEMALQNNHAMVYLSSDDMKTTVPNDDFVETSMKTLKLKLSPGHDPLYHQGRDIYQALLMCQAHEEVLYESVCDAFQFIRWHPNSMDVIPAGGSKAAGIAKMIDKLDIAPEHQYAFGDALNDLEMLQMIPNSIAMGNALPEAKAAAKFVTTSVDEDGIRHGLQMMGLL